MGYHSQQVFSTLVGNTLFCPFGNTVVDITVDHCQQIPIAVAPVAVAADTVQELVAAPVAAAADTVEELVAAVMELVELVADVTVVAAGLAAKNGQC